MTQWSGNTPGPPAWGIRGHPPASCTYYQLRHGGVAAHLVVRTREVGSSPSLSAWSCSQHRSGTHPQATTPSLATNCMETYTKLLFSLFKTNLSSHQ